MVPLQQCPLSDFEKVTDHSLNMLTQGLQQGNCHSSQCYNNSGFLLTLRKQLSVGNLSIEK